MKEQSALYVFIDVFLLTAFLNLNIPALSFCQRTPRDLSKKKELYAEAQHALSRTTPGTEHFRTIFSAAHRTLLGRLRHQYQFL